MMTAVFFWNGAGMSVELLVVGLVVWALVCTVWMMFAGKFIDDKLRKWGREPERDGDERS